MDTARSFFYYFKSELIIISCYHSLSLFSGISSLYGVEIKRVGSEDLLSLFRKKGELHRHPPPQVGVSLIQSDGDRVNDIAGLGLEGLSDLFHFS